MGCDFGTNSLFLQQRGGLFLCLAAQTLLSPAQTAFPLPPKMSLRVRVTSRCTKMHFLIAVLLLTFGVLHIFALPVHSCHDLLSSVRKYRMGPAKDPQARRAYSREFPDAWTKIISDRLFSGSRDREQRHFGWRELRWRHRRDYIALRLH